MRTSPTYKTPMLMAISTPSFSFLFIVMLRMIFQGSSANMKSMAAEYAAYGVNVRGLQISLRHGNSLTCREGVVDG